VVEMLNLRLRGSTKPVHLHEPYGPAPSAETDPGHKADRR
jgi:hypothetical protein